MQKKLSLDQARRIAVAAQGFCDPKPSGAVTARHFGRAMKAMTVLQLDSVNVLCRSHYLPMFARLGSYDRSKLDHYLYRSGQQYECWAHVASITAQAHQRLLRHRQTAGWGGSQRLKQLAPGYVEAVLAEVEANGATSVKTLSDPGQRSGPWWGLPKGKLALEYLFLTGKLSVAWRDHQFVTHYDLPERVLRADVLAMADLSETEAKYQLLILAARSHGVGTVSDLADYFRLNIVESRKLLERAVSAGELQEVSVQGWSEPAYLQPEARCPRSVSGAVLLSPFDPLVWHRDRTERLFGFRYRIEIYVPRADRVYGYYVLPFMVDGELVARVDLKSDRAAGLLRVLGVFLEPEVSADKARSQRVKAELKQAVVTMGQWLGLDATAEDLKM